MDKKKFSLRSRVFSMTLGLSIIVVVLIFSAFNLFLNNYIINVVSSQLELFTAHHSDEKDWPDMSKQPANKVGVKAEAFVINRDYQVIHAYGEEEMIASERISSYFKEKAMNLESIDNIRISTQNSTYYLSTVADSKHQNAYLVFFTDVTTIFEFSKTINTILVLVVVFASLLSFALAAVIANSVTKPIKVLASFADRIGKGDFSTDLNHFKDKELDDLGSVMNKTAVQLSHYDSSQKTFFQNASHELRTPLMAIRLNAEGIKYGLMETGKSSDVIIAEVDRLTELVEDLLYLSHVYDITSHIQMQENDLTKTIRRCAENQKSVAVQSGIEIVYDFAEMPVVISYNEKHMYRAVYNLISNALRYAKTKVVLSCRHTDMGVLIVVSDDGDGISSVDLPHIFDRFYKGSNGKHGIGLSIVKSAVELHGGKITFERTSTSDFLINLPNMQT
jgi:signal transduction histidine kinase